MRPAGTTRPDNILPALRTYGARAIVGKRQAVDTPSPVPHKDAPHRPVAMSVLVLTPGQSDAKTASPEDSWRASAPAWPLPGSAAALTVGSLVSAQFAGGSTRHRRGLPVGRPG